MGDMKNVEGFESSFEVAKVTDGLTMALRHVIKSYAHNMMDRPQIVEENKERIILDSLHDVIRRLPELTQFSVSHDELDEKTMQNTQYLVGCLMASMKEDINRANNPTEPDF